HVRHRNAWVVEEITLPTIPGRIPALRVCTSVGRKKEYKQLLPRSHLVESDRTRSNLASLAALPVRHANRDEDAAFWRTSAGYQRRRVRAKRSTRVRGGISNQTPAAHRLLRIVARHANGHAISVESGKEE